MSRPSLAAQRKQQRKAARAEKRPPGPVRRHLQAESQASYPDRRKATKEPARNLGREFQPPTSLDGASSDSEITVDPEHISRPSRVVRDKLAEDDERIATLERKLGRRSTNNGGDDIQNLLDELGDRGDSEDEPYPENRRKRSIDSASNAWLRAKRQKALRVENDGTDAERLPQSLHNHEDSSNGINGGCDDDVSLFDDENAALAVSEEPHGVRENPYVAPVIAPLQQKYISPPLRARASMESERLRQLQRRLQGLLNRLSEANMLNIVKQVEQIYDEHARNDVTTSLIETLVSVLSDPTPLNDTFVILHAGFITALYRLFGVDFGARVVQRIVEDFDLQMSKPTAERGKRATNLVNLLAELYNFQLVSSILIYDLVRKFTLDLSEDTAEMLLKITRNSGVQLRQDDPSTLKDVAFLLQASVGQVGTENLSVRTKFLIETIDNLKVDGAKTGLTASAITSEHIIRMKRILASMRANKSFVVKTSEPLRVGLDDIRDSRTRGRWWLVGASYKDGAQLQQSESQKAPTEQTGGTPETTSKASQSTHPVVPDVAILARAYGMNTDIRRAIFIDIMTAASVDEAYMRIVKMRLSKRQLPEVARVLVRCGTAERTYNPYYAQLAKRLCSEREIRKALWTPLLEALTALEEDEDEEAEEHEDDSRTSWWRELQSKVNGAKFYGALLANGAISLAVLKNRNLIRSPERAKIFLELLFIAMCVSIGRGNAGQLKVILLPMCEKEEMSELIKALGVFFAEVLPKSDLIGKGERRAVLWVCKTAANMLQNLQMNAS